MRASRTLRSASLLFAFGVVLAACGQGEPPVGEPTAPPVPVEDQSIVFGNFGAYTPEGFLEAFTAETGADVTISEFSTNEDMIGKLSAAQGTGFDVVMVTGNHLKTLVDAGYVAELDHAQLPNLANLYPEATQLAFDPGNKYSVAYTWGTTALLPNRPRENPDR